MKKYYTQIVTCCLNCPELIIDKNQTRMECGIKNNKFICWRDSDKEDTILPSWCPLDDLETKIKLEQELKELRELKESILTPPLYN